MPGHRPVANAVGGGSSGAFVDAAARTDRLAVASLEVGSVHLPVARGDLRITAHCMPPMCRVPCWDRFRAPVPALKMTRTARTSATTPMVRASQRPPPVFSTKTAAASHFTILRDSPAGNGSRAQAMTVQVVVKVGDDVAAQRLRGYRPRSRRPHPDLR